MYNYVNNVNGFLQGQSEIENHEESSEIPNGFTVKAKKCCDAKLCWYQPPVECLPMDFCNNTSLHGLKYMAQTKRHMTERIFWLLAFLIGCFAAVYLISDVWRRYNESPVIVSFEPEETNIDQIPFPAVTICNMNKVLRFKALKYQSDARNPELDQNAATAAQQNLYYMDHVCSSSKSFTRRFNLTTRGELPNDLKANISNWNGDNGTRNRRGVTEFLKAASQPCLGMIRLCTWKDKIKNCSEIFRPVETDFGKCCTFNMVPQTLLHRFRTDHRDDQTEINRWNRSNLEATWLPTSSGPDAISEEDIRPRRQNQAGKSFGLSILLDPDLDEYFCTTSDSVGFRLVTHLSTENPHVIDYGIAVTPNSEVFISIRPELTKADDTIHGYPLSSRNCYFPYEYNLTYYQYYSASNCIDECIAESVFKECYCVRYYMPRDDTRPLCGPKNFSCVENVTRVLADLGLKRNCSQCLPSCSEITYLEETTTTRLQSDADWKLDDHTNFNTSFNNFSIVHIYFGQDSTYARIRKELYGTTDLFANTGGLMGLCLGFSGLSAIEVLYFLTLRAWCRNRRKRTLGAKVAAKFRSIWVKVKYGTTQESASTKKFFIETRYPTPAIVDQDFIGASRLEFAPLGHGKYPNPQSDQTVLKKISPIFETPEKEVLAPMYNTIIHEISPFYAKREWNIMSDPNPT